MNGAPEITSEAALAQWLSKLPQALEQTPEKSRGIAIALAFRAALRILPAEWDFATANHGVVRGVTPLPSLYRLVVAGASSFSERDGLDAASHAAHVFYASSGLAVFLPLSPSAFGAVAAPTFAARFIVRTFEDAKGVGHRELRSDCAFVLGGGDLRGRQLFNEGDNPHRALWLEVRERHASMFQWAFWIDWYEKCLAGAPQDWEGLLTDIAVIPSDEWDKGPEHIAELIAQLQKKHEATAPRLAENTLRAIQTAVARNGPALALQLDALAQLVEIELERIRGKNPEDDLAQQEREHLIAVFTRMREAIASMRALLPADGRLDDAGAQEMGGWAVVLAQAGEAWNSEAKRMLLNDPASKVETAGRLVAAGSVAGVLTACGLPILGAIAGGVIIGEKKLTDLTKAVRGLGSGGS